MPTTILWITVATSSKAQAPGSSDKIGVVLVESLQVVRAGINLLLSTQPDMSVVAEAASPEAGWEAIRRLRQTRHVVAVIGLGMPGERDAFWLIRTIREALPMASILACGAHADENAVSQALFVGADGFADKNADPADFIDAVRRTAAGELVLAGLPPTWLGGIAEGLDRRASFPPTLTEREVEVLVVAAEGLTARQIGHRLGVRERTVTTHLGRIYKKLGTGSRVGALNAASRSGLVHMGV